ncbi:hypothetical protein RUM44_001826 [Polyplax serrata]|uniref:Uncharacterized protein n=1 Tax=Polyplax serrata TaxID=468196 RepID=A0ABR1AL50_POLSC
MSELVIESVGKRGVMLKLVRLQSLSTWALRILDNLPAEKPKAPQVIGPKNDIIADVIRQLVEKFKSEVIDINKLNSSSFEFSGSESTGKKSVLLYSHTPVTSEVAIAELTAVIEKTFERVDVLVVAQDKNPVQRDTPHSFLNQLNKELLQQFWTVMAFLPGMLRRNKGHIVSIELDRSSLVNSGVMRTIYEDLLQSDTKVKLTLIERNNFLENFLPPLSAHVLARFIVESMWNSSSVVKIPSVSAFLTVIPKNICGGKTRYLTVYGMIRVTWSFE